MPTLESLEPAARYYRQLLGLNADAIIKKNGNKFPTWQSAALRIQEHLAVFETIKVLANLANPTQIQGEPPESPDAAQP